MKENSIEEDIEIVKNLTKYFYKNKDNGNKASLMILGEEIIAIEHIVADKARLQKENKQLKEENEQLKAFVKSIFDENIEEKYISIDSIEEVIKKIDEAEKCARDCIKEKVIIADSDSLNFGRKQAHGYDEQLLQDLIKEKR